jgi:preprotein translocase subunit SecF
MLDFVGTIVTAALTVFVVTALLVFMDISRSTKLTVAALLGLWIGLAAAAGAAGWLSMPPGRRRAKRC